MKAAYGTFWLLLLIRCHDMVADAAVSKFNVRWSRTSPIIVSAVDEGTFLTNLYNWSINKINTGITEYKAGNYVKGLVEITKGTGGVYLWGSTMFYEIWPEGVWPKIN